MGFIIFSVHQAQLDRDTNNFNQSKVAKLLDSVCVGWEYVAGCYKGIHEGSFLVANNENSEDMVQSLCDLFNQESYLKVDNNKNTSLCSWKELGEGEFTYFDRVESSVGLFQQVCRSIAESLGNYTRHGDNYYVASKDLFPRPSYKGGI